MSERSSVRFGNTTIEYEVRRSERRKKTVQITVDGGGVQVAAPTTTSDRKLRAIVRKRVPWILSQASGAMLEARPRASSAERLCRTSAGTSALSSRRRTCGRPWSASITGGSG